ncbi:hypothetical protein H6F77_18745 [Microcoleus sp. FACHB-831]|jgi:hypothetical protein|uniref:hypothetical protein n=1 Tax=Microcoleus sp. FACHB-831 TaxID=2692827 RepID=UPI00168214BC|nr:hypothetical protein [Microcoleus sp. FACHB-831]MBD1923094.1 hypothetical protein [Microcoleus sp. FACHB-831]
MDTIFQLLLSELQQSTRVKKQNCRDVAERLATEVMEICTGSDRIIASGEMETWATLLAQHRLQQCLRYYKLGSCQGRVQLNNTLGGLVSVYFTIWLRHLSEQAQLTRLEDFLQGFYMEALNTFRQEAHLSKTYHPQTLLELAEYMSFTERYAKRRIPLFNELLGNISPQDISSLETPMPDFWIFNHPEFAEYHQRRQILIVLRAQTFLREET